MDTCFDSFPIQLIAAHIHAGGDSVGSKLFYNRAASEPEPDQVRHLPQITLAAPSFHHSLQRPHSSSPGGSQHNSNESVLVGDHSAPGMQRDQTA